MHSVKNRKLYNLKIGNISNASHLAWLYDIYCKTGIRVPFPIIADRNGTIARKYGMISNDISNTETVRNVFIIDDKGIVRAILVYPMNVGRCIPEILRLLQALQIADCNKGAIPANWCPYEPMIVPIPQTYQCLEEKMHDIGKNRNGFNWYLSFKQPKQCCDFSIEENEAKQIESKKELK